jgi:hypothetical protein
MKLVELGKVVDHCAAARAPKSRTAEFSGAGLKRSALSTH